LPESFPPRRTVSWRRRPMFEGRLRRCCTLLLLAKSLGVVNKPPATRFSRQLPIDPEQDSGPGTKNPESHAEMVGETRGATRPHGGQLTRRGLARDVLLGAALVRADMTLVAADSRFMLRGLTRDECLLTCQSTAQCTIFSVGSSSLCLPGQPCAFTDVCAGGGPGAVKRPDAPKGRE